MSGGKAMTPEEWQVCDDPVPMLHSLRGRATERKLRLWSVACCKRALCRPQLRWDRAGHLAAWRALAAAERDADGLVPAQALEEACAAAWRAPSGSGEPGDVPAWAACHAPAGAPSSVWWSVLLAVKGAAECARCCGGDPEAERRAHADLLREVFGPRAGRGVAFASHWLAREGGAVRRLAGAAYGNRPPSAPWIARPWPCCRTPPRRPAATTRNYCATCAAPARTRPAAGPWTNWRRWSERGRREGPC